MAVKTMAVKTIVAREIAGRVVAARTVLTSRQVIDSKGFWVGRFRRDEGGVSVIAGIAALTIGVLAAASIVVAVMVDHANAVPGPGANPPAPVGPGN